jgi:hypothetical protein
MRGEQEDFVLGEDVTSLARSKIRKESVVLSVRLSAEEFAAVDALSRETGRTPSQTVRNAIKDYVHGSRAGQLTITISLAGGSTLATGIPSIWGRASSAETYTPLGVLLT